MQKSENLKKNQLIMILLLSGFIILSESLQSLMLIKDISYFENYKILIGKDISFNEYISNGLIMYLQSIIVPLILSIYTFATYKKIKINMVYKGVWILFLISSFVMKLVEFNIYSIFYYITLVLYLLLLPSGNEMSS